MFLCFKSILNNQTVQIQHIFCRDIIADYMYNAVKDDGQIGGPGLHVEIDESLFGKLKVMC